MGDSVGDTLLVMVGESPGFLIVTSSNKCGAAESNRLFLPAPVPPLPKLVETVGPYSYPEILVTNIAEIDDIQWYRNSQPIPGDPGKSGSITVNRNGLYTAESISREGCTNRVPEEDGITIDEAQYIFQAFRLNEKTIVIENTSTKKVDFNLISVGGVVQKMGTVNPGTNEIRFDTRGIFLIHFFGNGIDQVLKAYF